MRLGIGDMTLNRSITRVELLDIIATMHTFANDPAPNSILNFLIAVYDAYVVRLPLE